MYKSGIDAFKTLNIYKFINNEDLKHNINKVIEIVEPILNSINGEFKEYTMHDIGHSFRVAKYMDEMALGLDKKNINQNKEKFSDLEYALMILSALLHDIGMHYSDKEAEEIKNSQMLFLGKFKYQGVLKRLQKDNPSVTEKQVIHEVIRRIHHVRTAEWIYNSEIKKYLVLDEIFDFSDAVSSLCKSHGEDYSFIKELEHANICGDYKFDMRYIAVLLRIADLLDIDGQRTPKIWYNLHKPQGKSKREWQKHFIISNKKKLFEVDGELRISFFGKSSDPEIHRSYLKYIDDLRKELSYASYALEKDPIHTFIISDKLDDHVDTEGFEYVDLRLNLDYKSITELLMGVNIYHDKRLGLRELIQNSIDACKLRQERDASKLVYPYVPQIIIEISQKKGYVKLIDNGIGMDMNVIKNYFLNVGISYYTSEEFDNNDYIYKPIGKFGIGFLACYLLSNKVRVKTKHYISHEIVEIELECGSEYVVTKRDSQKDHVGTEIELVFQDFFKVFSDIEDLKTFIGRYFFSEIPIRIIDSDSEKELPYLSCSKYFQKVPSAFKESEKYFIENIICNNYWDSLKGNILIRYKDFEISEVSYAKDIEIYVYDTREGLFKKLLPYNVEDGNYFEFVYPVLKTQDVLKIKNRDIQEREDRLVALAKSEGTLFKFIIPANTPYDFNSYSGKVTINSIDIEQVLEKSQVTSLGISFRTLRSHMHMIYKHGLNALRLLTTRLYNYGLSSMENLSEIDSYKNEGSLYYRDIYVKNASFAIATPFNFRIIGCCINNLDTNNRLSLNVARQGFVDEKPYILCIFYIILKYFDDGIKTKTETLRCYLDMQYERLLKEFQ